jgi:hypothetical protein
VQVDVVAVEKEGVEEKWKADGYSMHLKTMASEEAFWDESPGGNVTESEYGKYYTRPAGWVYAWKQTVG